MAYVCGIDIGGTFTDCVLVDADGRVTTAKAPSTPADFSQGVLAALERAAETLDLPLATLIQQIDVLTHGTTTGTNALIQWRGARVGFITTLGHEDSIRIMRGSRGLTGQNLRQLVHFPESSKPPPIVPGNRVKGVSERIDCDGDIVAPLNEEQVEVAVTELLADGVDAIAINFLWSFKNPSHEQRAQQIVHDMAPELFVSCSHQLVPKWGEYERSVATLFNAYIGPVTRDYLTAFDARLKALDFDSPLRISQCFGGSMSLDHARASPLLTLDSGPAVGVAGSAYLGSATGCPNVITTDMGGTSFDVGVVRDSEPSMDYTSRINQYEFFIPKVDIQVIGAGGGSIAWFDASSGSLQVGPRSAGADPGPVCYGRGGREPTVTDANLLLGRLDPEDFASGLMPLDVQAAEAALAELGARLGMDALQCALGISRISETKMALLIRQMTVERGLDPRDFVLFSFGGAGPLHAVALAEELGIAKVIVPQRAAASVWCAYGATVADIMVVKEKVDIQTAPFDLNAVNENLRELGRQARNDLPRGLGDSVEFAFWINLRHANQIHEVEVPVAGVPLTGADLKRLDDEFYRLYERRYGAGTAFRGTALEAVTFRCQATVPTRKPNIRRVEPGAPEPPPAALKPERQVYWPDSRARAATPVYNGDELRPGNRIDGPALVDTAVTTILTPPGYVFSVDTHDNFVLEARV